jgi:hypothetical protein
VLVGKLHGSARRTCLWLGGAGTHDRRPDGSAACGAQERPRVPTHLVCVVSGGRAALQVADVAALLCDDQSPLKLQEQNPVCQPQRPHTCLGASRRNNSGEQIVPRCGAWQVRTCPVSLALIRKYVDSSMGLFTPLGTYTNEPSEKTAEFSAAK